MEVFQAAAGTADKHRHGRRVWEGETRVVDPAAPVKIVVDGLQPGTEYRYRVEDETGAVMDGRFSHGRSGGRSQRSAFRGRG